MTKKDYELIAKAINDVYFGLRTHSPATDTREIGVQTLGRLVANLGQRLQQDNPKFNPDRFMEACFKV